VPVGLDRHRLRELFPVLAERLPVSQLAFVLTATRVVGMECPGLHSILSGLDLTFDVPPATAEPAVAYRVVRAEPRLSLLRLELTGPGATGVVTALVRPPPVAQAGMEDLAPLVPAAAFESQRALVVGGSRGLGEVTAKILALGGADVRISFAQGEADAACVAEEIVRHGGRCSAFRFDVTAEAPDAGAALLQGWTPTHLYYFASPPIRLSAGTGWDRSLFERYCDYYLDGLRRSMTTFVPEPDAAGARLAVVYPSTAFLDEARPGAQEYAAAKAAGEALCRSLAAARPGLHVFCPRLPPLRTDQTSTLRGRSDAADPVPVLLPLLREVAAVTA
jgi:NAD(P)-dependent dehydrogenase (short-subunit alcohol dehydrogenase family)